MLPFNFRRASRNQPQLPGPSLEPMIWDDDTPRRLWSEDGYIMVASMPRLTDNRGTVCSLPPHYPTKKADDKNSRRLSRIVHLSMRNMSNLTWASLPPALTKQGNTLTDLEKCVAKSDLSRGGSPLD